MLEQAKKLADIYATLDAHVSKLEDALGVVDWSLFKDVYEMPSVIFALVDVEDDDPAYYALEDYLKSDKSESAFETFVKEAQAGYQD